MSKSLEVLFQLADVYGVQTAYDSDKGERCVTTPETLMAVLRVLGAPIQHIDDATEALRQRWHGFWHRLMEPACVAWDGRNGEILLRLPGRQTGTLTGNLQLESGEVRSWSCAVNDLQVVESAMNEDVA